jgi:3-hydroxyisobutyrate dehydrogenase
MQIGIAGTGRMGTAMARRLLDHGHTVRVWNRTPAGARHALDAGARWVGSLAELAEISQVIISSLSDNAAVESVYLGDDGLLSGGAEGGLFIEMSTVSPGTHAHIAPIMASRGAAFIECPVSGSVGAVLSGTLVGFAGGDPAAVSRATPLLAQLCRRVEPVGGLGSGARMKLAANLLLTVFWQALGESLLLVDTGAVDPALAIDLLADSNIGAGILRARGEQIVGALHGNAPAAAAFDVDTMRKDLRYMVQEAAIHESALPLASRTLECFDRASHDGGGNTDGVAYPAYWVSHGGSAAAAPQ